MWPWLQNVPKRHKFWIKLIAFSAIIHACLLFCVLFMYRGYYSSFTLHLGKQIPADARVIFLPFHKVAPAQSKIKSGASEKAAQTVSAPIEQAPAEQKKEQAPVVQTEKKEIVPELKTTLAVEKRAVTAKKKASKKNAPKKVKKAAKKELPKKVKSEKKVAELKPEKKIEKVQEPIAPSAVPATPMGAAIDADSAIYVGTLELDALMLQQEIQSSLEKVWTPPPGLAPNLLCQIQITIDWEGKVRDTAVTASSGILLYDMSAREAITALEFPKVAWGKTITITFNE